MPLGLQKAYNYDYIQGTSWLLFSVEVDQGRSMRFPLHGRWFVKTSNLKRIVRENTYVYSVGICAYTYF